MKIKSLRISILLNAVECVYVCGRWKESGTPSRATIDYLQMNEINYAGRGWVCVWEGESFTRPFRKQRRVIGWQRQEGRGRKHNRYSDCSKTNTKCTIAWFGGERGTACLSNVLDVHSQICNEMAFISAIVQVQPRRDHVLCYSLVHKVDVWVCRYSVDTNVMVLMAMSLMWIVYFREYVKGKNPKWTLLG